MPQDSRGNPRTRPPELQPYRLVFPVNFLVRVLAPSRADAERLVRRFTLDDALTLFSAYSLSVGADGLGAHIEEIVEEEASEDDSPA